MNLAKKSAYFLLSISVSFLFCSRVVFAGYLTNLSDTMSSVKVAGLSNHDITFVTPTGIAAGEIVTLTFPSNFSIPVSFSFSDADILDNGVDVTLAAAPSGTTWGVSRTSATTLTVTNGSAPIPSGHTIRIKLGTNASHQSFGIEQVTNDDTPGNKIIAIAGSFADIGDITVHLLNNDTVAVYAVVPQAFSFSVSSNAIRFGSLSAGSPRYASSTGEGDSLDVEAHTVSISTNAPWGYVITVQGQTLTSQQNISNTITAIGPTPTLPSAGSEQFGIYAVKTGGLNGTVSTPYATPGSFGYVATATTSDTFASGTSSTGQEVFSVHYVANVATLTEAGTYAATIVYVGTSNY